MITQHYETEDKLNAWVRHPAGGTAVRCEVEREGDSTGVCIQLPEGFRGGRIVVSGFRRGRLIRVLPAELFSEGSATSFGRSEPICRQGVAGPPRGRKDLSLFWLVTTDEAEIEFETTLVEPSLRWRLHWQDSIVTDQALTLRWLQEWLMELSDKVGNVDFIWPFLDSMALHGGLTDRLLEEKSHLEARLTKNCEEIEYLNRRIADLEGEATAAKSQAEKAESELRRRERELSRRKLNLADSFETAVIELKWPTKWFGRKRKHSLFPAKLPSGDLSGAIISIDPIPSDSFSMGNEVMISGWILGKERRHPECMRIIVKNREFLVDLGTYRPEVQALIKGHPLSGKCGFVATVLGLRPPDHMEIQAKLGDREWETIWCGAAKDLVSERSQGGDQWKDDPALSTRPPMWMRASMIRRLGGHRFDGMVSIVIPLLDPSREKELLKITLASLNEGIWTPNKIYIVLLEEWSPEMEVSGWFGGTGNLSNKLQMANLGTLPDLMGSAGVVSGFLVLRPGVRVTVDALGLFARASELAKATLIYADHAVATNTGQVESLKLRPAFSPEFMRQAPYVNDGFFLSKELADRLAKYEFETSDAFFELLIRASITADVITHITEVALTVSRDVPLPFQEAINQERLLREEEPGITVDQSEIDGLFILRRPLPKAKVGIIILTRDGHEVLKTCIDSYCATLPSPEEVPWEIVIVDNGSNAPEALDYLSELGHCHRVVRHVAPFNYSQLNNLGAGVLSDDVTHILFSNNDMEAIQPGWLEALLSPFARDDVGITGARLFYPDGSTLQHAGVVVGLHGAADHLGRFQFGGRIDGEQTVGSLGIYLANREVAAVTGACLMMRRDLFKRLGGFDETLVVGFNDTDLCLRCWKEGFSVLYVGEAALLHHESYSRGKQFDGDVHPEDTEIFRKRWSSLLKQGDPFYHPRLVHDSTTGSIDSNRPGRCKGSRRIIQRGSSWLPKG